MNTTIAEIRGLAPLNSNTPSAADGVCKMGAEILVNEEDKQRKGTFIIVIWHRRQVKVRTLDSIKRKWVPFESYHTKRTYKKRYNFTSKSDDYIPKYTVNITEVIEPHDPGEYKFDEAMKREIEDLLKRKTLTIICNWGF